MKHFKKEPYVFLREPFFRDCHVVIFFYIHLCPMTNHKIFIDVSSCIVLGCNYFPLSSLGYINVYSRHTKSSPWLYLGDLLVLKEISLNLWVGRCISSWSWIYQTRQWAMYTRFQRNSTHTYFSGSQFPRITWSHVDINIQCTPESRSKYCCVLHELVHLFKFLQFHYTMESHAYSTTE